MSKTSTHETELPDEELAELLGSGNTAPIRDAEAEEIADVLGAIRRQLLAAAIEEGVSTREMARRLGVSAAAVSRQLRSNHDLRVSTVVLLARALKRGWHVDLGKATQAAPPREHARAPKPASILSPERMPKRAHG